MAWSTRFNYPYLSSCKRNIIIDHRCTQSLSQSTITSNSLSDLQQKPGG